MNPATKRVSLNCLRTQQEIRMPLEQNGSLSIKRLQEFIHDAIGIRYKDNIFGRYIVLPPNLNGYIESPEEGWEGLVLEICYRSIAFNENLHDPLSIPLENEEFEEKLPVEKTFQCTQCLNLYKDRKTLKRHIERVHEKSLHYECAECSKKFFQNSELKRHIHTVHERSANVHCERCGKVFSHKNALLKHRRLPICPRLKKIYEIEAVPNISLCSLPILKDENLK